MDIAIEVIPDTRDREKEFETFLDKPPLTYSQINNQSTTLNLMIAHVREIHYHTGQIVYIAKMRKGKLVWDYRSSHCSGFTAQSLSVSLKAILWGDGLHCLRIKKES